MWEWDRDQWKSKLIEGHGWLQCFLLEEGQYENYTRLERTFNAVVDIPLSLFIFLSITIWTAAEDGGAGYQPTSYTEVVGVFLISKACTGLFTIFTGQHFYRHVAVGDTDDNFIEKVCSQHFLKYMLTIINFPLWIMLTIGFVIQKCAGFDGRKWCQTVTMVVLAIEVVFCAFLFFVLYGDGGFGTGKDDDEGCVTCPSSDPDPDPGYDYYHCKPNCDACDNAGFSTHSDGFPCQSMKVFHESGHYGGPFIQEVVIMTY
eukprot:COSAG01_NODE_13937_length_1516_cov_1.361327_1_plen_259_part_00